MDQAYQDKLDGKISEEFWARKATEWQSEEQQILASIQSVKAALFLLQAPKNGAFELRD